jgi:pyruvate dehydrogenase kinase 2/3/4
MHEGPVGGAGSSIQTPPSVSYTREGPGTNGSGFGANGLGGPRLRIPIERRCVWTCATKTARYSAEIRYFSPPPSDTVYPLDGFTRLLQNIKTRHDPTVTTVAQGVLEWKRKQGKGKLDQSIQEWLDRFYLSRIGIRFLIGQRE